MDYNLSEETIKIYDKIISWIPEFLKFILILIIGYIIAKILRSAVIAALRGLHVDRRVQENKGWTFMQKISKSPSVLIGNIVYWLIFILILTIAIPLLNIPVLNQIIFGFYAYLPNIIASILIILIATAIAAGIDAIIIRLMGDTPTGKILATATPSLILTIATFMVLVQLKIATPIIVITYAAIWGALALGFALAFGLGGRDLAGRILEDAYNKGKENIGQAKKDIDLGKERGKEEMR